MRKILAGTILAALTAGLSPAAVCAQTSVAMQLQLIGRGLTGITVTPASQGLACSPTTGFTFCLSYPGGIGGAPAGSILATLAPVTVPKGQAITSITMGGTDAAKFALSANCNPYATGCSLAIGAAVLPVSALDTGGNPIPYTVTLTATAP